MYGTLCLAFNNGKLQFEVASILSLFNKRYVYIIDKELDREKIRNEGVICKNRQVSLINKHVSTMNISELYGLAKTFIRQAHKNGFIKLEDAVEIIKTEQSIYIEI
jgi:hypothetical protein